MLTFVYISATIGTSKIRPCIAVIAFDGDKAAVGHLFVCYSTTEKNVREFVKWLKTNFYPENSCISLIGGMHVDKEEYIEVIITSERMIEVVERELQREGFSIEYRDLFGRHERELIVSSDGKMIVNDSWQRRKRGRYPYEVNLSALLQKKKNPLRLAERAPKGLVERFLDHLTLSL